MRAALLAVLLLGACDGSALPAVEVVEHPAELAGTWTVQLFGEIDDRTAFVLHPDGRAEKQWLDEDGGVAASEPGSWRVDDGSLVVALEWTTLTSRFRLDGDVLSLGLFEKRMDDTGLATFEADVYGFHPVPPPQVLSFLRPGDYVSHRVALTISADYSTVGYTQRDDHGDCIQLAIFRTGHCELDETGALSCTIPQGERTPYTVRAPLDAETGLPRLEGLPSGYLRWQRDAS
jgi:hypothetical protein